MPSLLHLNAKLVIAGVRSLATLEKAQKGFKFFEL